MSLFGSLFTGVSALTAQSQSMSMIATNIANVNTTGYKRAVASFESVVTQAGTGGSYAPGGVLAKAVNTVTQQGLLQQTSSSTDAAIAGNGFFIVREEPSTEGQTFFTRAGSFSQDSLGFLRNDSNFYLMGWRLDANGDLPSNNADLASLEPVDVSFLNGLAAPTSTVQLGANLKADATPAVIPAYNFSRAVTVFDGLGAAHDATLNFRKTANLNEWTLDFDIPDAGFTSSHTITFDGSGALSDIDGTPATTSTVISLTGIDWTDTISGAADSDIDFDIASLTQFASDFSVAFVEQNGAELGLRTGIKIDADGTVTATFSNGQSRPIFKIPLATFTNPNGMQSRTGNVFIATDESGDFNLREAGLSGAGVLSPSALESSNVDLADEFSRMIITQRAFSGGTKVITTADQMLDELLRIR
jgi:flagellar hook protein FlgE